MVFYVVVCFVGNVEVLVFKQFCYIFGFVSCVCEYCPFVIFCFGGVVCYVSVYVFVYFLNGVYFVSII